MSKDVAGALNPLLEQAHRYAREYLDVVEDMPTHPTAESVAALSAFEGPLPNEPSDATEMLAMLHAIGSPATCAQIVGRYFGFVNGGAHPPAVAARWLADVWDQNTALAVMSPVSSRLEAICERWLVELLGLPEGTAAGFVTGTSIASTCGLAAARNHALQKQGWDVRADGLFGAPPIRVVLGREAHAAIYRSLSLLGLGQNRVEVVEADGQGRMIASQLPELDDSTIVIVQAGNVNTGAFDPMREICERARAAGAWVHVDGAFGLWAGASRSKRALFDGAELADSWSVDAHKTLNVPYDCGIVLTRDREAHVAALDATASYLQRGQERDGISYTPDMSRRARVVELWATLKTLGRAGVEQLVDELCERAQQFATRLTAEGFDIPNDVVFNQVLVACESVDERDAWLARLNATGECWCGGAIWQDRAVVRISVCSWATTEEDVERSVAALVKTRAAVRA